MIEVNKKGNTMGIVVTVFMILILLLSTPNPFRKRLEKAQTPIAILALLVGGWNVGWYWSQHIGEFWGNMALASGVLMIFTSLLLFTRVKFAHMLTQITPLWFKALALIVLAIFAVYYAYTIILLNL